MTNLVFLESKAQVVWAEDSLPHHSPTRFVAMTAQALQALEEYGLPHETVSSYADMRLMAIAEKQFNLDIFALAQEIETFIAERYSPVRFDGPGFLSGQGYYLQYSVSAIAVRAFLMRETIRTCVPTVVTIFDSDIDPWFASDGYARNPWLDLVEEFAAESGFQLEVVPRGVLSDEGTPSSRSSGFPDALGVLRIFPQRVYRYTKRKTRDFLRDLSQIHLLRPANDRAVGFRLLMADCHWYDWAPVLAVLQYAKNVTCFGIEGLHLDSGAWTYHYAPLMRRLWHNNEYDLELGLPQVDQVEVQTLSCLFDEWLRRRPNSPKLNVLGMNLFPALMLHLRAVTVISPVLVRHADEAVRRALEIARPHAVCFNAMPSLAAKRFAYECRQQKIPAVSYQHGGSYGTHSSIKNEQAEAGHAGYFLTYGTGIRPPDHSAFPLRAEYVPIGSTRIERMRAQKRLRGKPLLKRRLNVLWVAEVSTGNSVGGMFQVEDTQRYLLQKRCLGILDDADALRIIYRPFVNLLEQQGTPSWIESSRPSIKIDSTHSLEKLIRAADIVISDTTSGTIWNEVLALGKPLILYCDPEQTRMIPHFMEDLEHACYWCRSVDELVAAVRRLATEGAAFVTELQQIDTTNYLRNYVLHRDDGQCRQRVISFLNDVYCKGQSDNEWKNSIE